MTALFTKFVDAVVKIATALENLVEHSNTKDAFPVSTPVGVGGTAQNPNQQQPAETPAVQNPIQQPGETPVRSPGQVQSPATSPMDVIAGAGVSGPADVHVGVVQQPVQTPVQQPTQAPTQAPTQTPAQQSVGWDPTKAEIQGSYRTKIKQDALEATLAQLGITAPKSWTFAKKHRAILDHVAQYGATAAMTWADFEVKIREFVADGHRDLVLAVVQEIEGHQVIAEPNVNTDNYKTIIDTVAARAAASTGNSDQDIITKQVDPGTLRVQENPPMPADQPVDYVPGAPVSSTDEFRAYARYLTENGLSPAAVQAALAPIAAGVTYVTQEQIPQAVQALIAASTAGAVA